MDPPRKGDYGCLPGLGKIWLEIVKPGQSLSHNGRQPSPARLASTGPSREPQATLGRQVSKAARAGEAEAKPQGCAGK